MFAEAQVYGRVAKLSLAAIGRPGLDGRSLEPLDADVRFHLEWMRDRVLQAKPRVISVEAKPTYHLFLDGACTAKVPGAWSGTSIGGVLLDSHGAGVGSFGEMLPDSVTNVWGKEHQEQLIFEAEIMPFVVALDTWSKQLTAVNLFIYIDNEAAKSCWINASADTECAKKMVHRGVHLEAEFHTTAFFCRVPTHSNIADGPSRGQFTEAESIGATCVRIGNGVLERCAGL